MPPLSVAAYNGAKALIERDFADDPTRLQAALARLEALRVVRATRPAICATCGRALSPAQVLHCSPSCANAEWERDRAAQHTANERTKARWAAEDAAAATDKDR
jgi:hypothetical protein